MLRRLLVTRPAELPVSPAQRLERVERVRGQEAGETYPAQPPASVDEHFPFAAEARQKIGRGLFRADDARGRCCFHNSDVDQAILVERRADRKTFNPWPRLNVRGLNPTNARAGRVHGEI